MPLVVLPRTLNGTEQVRAETTMTARDGHAQMSALIVVAGIPQTGVVSKLVIDPDASGTREIPHDGLRYSSAKFVLPNELARLLGGPVEIVLEYVQRYRVSERLALQDDFPVGTGHPDRLDGVQLAIGPIERVIHGVIDGERRRTGDPFSHEQLASVAIHPTYLDLWLITRVGPHELPSLGIDDHRCRLLEAHRDQTASIPAVRFGYHDPTARIGPRLIHLAPIQIAGDPVHR